MKRIWAILTAAVLSFLAAAYPIRADLIDGTMSLAHAIVPPVTYIGGTPQISSLDCFRNVFLGGNAQFTLAAGPPSLPYCHLNIQNIDTYSGSGTGRGKLMSFNGITAFILYPGQKWDVFASTSGWVSEQTLAGSQGMVWNAPFAVHFFIDTGGSDSVNDGLASGAAGSFATRTHCALAAYNIAYTRNQGSTQCSLTAAQATTEQVQVFYPLNGGGTLIFNSASPGSQASWICPAAQLCLQFGDNALVGVTDTNFITNPNSTAVISGHQDSVLDLNTNNSFGGNGAQPIFNCDQDSHFNINNGFTYTTGWTFLFSGCPNSTWNINGAVNSGGTQSVGRTFNFVAGTIANFQGNVTWGTTGLTVSVGLVTGNSVLNNAAGTPAGGAPTPTTGGQYCTSAC